MVAWVVICTVLICAMMISNTLFGNQSIRCLDAFKVEIIVTPVLTTWPAFLGGPLVKFQIALKLN